MRMDIVIWVYREVNSRCAYPAGSRCWQPGLHYPVIIPETSIHKRVYTERRPILDVAEEMTYPGCAER